MPTCAELKDEWMALLLAYDENNNGVIDIDELLEALDNSVEALDETVQGKLSNEKLNVLREAWDKQCQFDPSRCSPVVDTYLDTLRQFDTNADGRINTNEAVVDSAGLNLSPSQIRSLDADEIKAVKHVAENGCEFSVGDRQPTGGPNYDIDVIEWNGPDLLCVGESGTITFTVENTGPDTSPPITLQIHHRIGRDRFGVSEYEVVAESSSSALDPGETKTLTHDVEMQDKGTEVYAGTSENDDTGYPTTDTVKLNIDGAIPQAKNQSLDAPDTACTGGTVAATYSFTNETDCSGTINIDFNGRSISRDVSPGENVSVTEEFEMPSGSLDIDVLATSAGDQVGAQSVTVNQGEFSSLQSTTLTTPNRACEGEIFFVTYDILNGSGCPVTVDITLMNRTETVDLGGNDSARVRREVTMPSSDITIRGETRRSDTGEVLDRSSKTVKSGRVDTDFRSESYANFAQIGETISPLSVTVVGDSECTAPGTAEIIDRDTGNVLDSQDLQLGGSGETELNFEATMPTRVFRGRFRVVDNNGEVRLTSTFRVTPIDSVIIRTGSRVDMWGSSSGSIDYKGVVKGVSISSENIESEDSFRGKGTVALFEVSAEEGGRDSMTADKIDNITIQSSKAVKFAVDGSIEGEGTRYTMDTGLVGSIGVLNPIKRKSIVNPVDEEITNLSK